MAANIGYKRSSGAYRVPAGDFWLALQPLSLRRGRCLRLVIKGDQHPGCVLKKQQVRKMPRRVQHRPTASSPRSTPDMEPVSLGVGIFALVGLFENAIVCFNYIQLAKSIGPDLHICAVRLACLQLRLSRWGVAIGIDKGTTDIENLKSTALSKQDISVAEDLMGSIQVLFGEAEKIAAKHQKSQKTDEATHTDLDKLEGICEAMRNISFRRQRKSYSEKEAGPTSSQKRLKWAIYSREKLLGLVDQLKNLIGELVDLFTPPERVSLQQSLCDKEALALLNEEALSQLEEVAAVLDPQLAQAIARQEARSV